MKWLITGGAGFIGVNVARRLLREQYTVVVLDNLARAGAAQNLFWLQQEGQTEFINVDVRDADAVNRAFSRHRDVDVVLHLAAQVAVTLSVQNPRHDFEVNALGTLNVLESVRRYCPEAVLLNASTNKVYGSLAHLPVEVCNGRNRFRTLPYGIAEDCPLDFHSPYGCSKGAADQYVCDYARTYGLRTVNFRQSCIYGIRQFGMEDQGWVAWFAICAVLGRPITLYGDGQQVRDVLWVDDLVEAYLRAAAQIKKTSGQSYNIGGGPENTLSLRELIAWLETKLHRPVETSFADPRPGDQRVFICDIRKARREFGWEPQTSVSDGLSRLVDWIVKNREQLDQTVRNEVAAANR